MNYLVIDLEMCRVKKLYRKTYKYARVNSNPRIPFVTQDSLFVNENPVL